MNKTIIVFLVVILSAVSAFADEQKKILIGTEGAFPPWNFIDDSGQLAGFEIDLAEDLCQRMNRECELVSHNWRGIIPALQQGQFDAIMAGMAITTAREKSVTFSRYYAATPSTFIVRKDSPLKELDIGLPQLTLSDLSTKEKAALDVLAQTLKGKIIGVQFSTIQENFANLYLSGTAKIRSYDFQDSIDLELFSGRLDAVIGPMSYWVPMIRKQKESDFILAGPQFTGGPFGRGVGVAVRKEDTQLAALFSNAINAAILDKTLSKLALKWFTFDASAKE